MSRIQKRPIRVLNGATANGAGGALEVANYEDIVATIITTGNTTATIKFAISMELNKPNFGAAITSSNVYDYIQITPKSDSATPIIGTTGVVLTGTDQIKIYDIDTRFIRWICPIVSGYSAGTITVEIDAVNNTSRG